MKQIQYYINNPVNKGTEELPEWTANLFLKTMPYSEANEAIAGREAYNGEYTFYDDGNEEDTKPTQEERITELEKAFALLLSGDVLTVLGKYGVSADASHIG